MEVGASGLGGLLVLWYKQIVIRSHNPRGIKTSTNLSGKQNLAVKEDAQSFG